MRMRILDRLLQGICWNRDNGWGQMNRQKVAREHGSLSLLTSKQGESSTFDVRQIGIGTHACRPSRLSRLPPSCKESGHYY